MRLTFALCTALLLAACGAEREPAPRPAAATIAALVPQPLVVEPAAGRFRFGVDATVSVAGIDGDNAALDWMIGNLAAAAGTSIRRGDDRQAALRLAVVPPSELPWPAEPGPLDEAYVLRIGATHIDVAATSAAGLFYALTTLYQLAASDAVLPQIYIVDQPRFRWRGLMLDSARHFQSADYIKRYIDWMSLHKLNVFHWHLTDDQAWRLEITAYPELTGTGAWRVPAGAAARADIDPRTGQPRLYGGYYSQQDVREIVAHAAARHVTIVPEINVPGHATAAIAAYPELGVAGAVPGAVSSSWGVHRNVLNIDESTFRFFENVLDEVLGLFPGEFIHLGGDEVVTAQWAASPQVRQRMASLGLAELGDVQNYFVERLQAYLAPHGRRVIGWDEILESDLPADAAVMSWRGIDGALEAAAKGHDTVLSPAPTLYLDHIQTDATDAPPGRGGVVSTEDIYRFDPLPEALQGNADHVLGVQGNLWTEHVRTEARVSYMTYPRALAIAEVGWSAAERRDWPGFADRLARYLPRLQEWVPAAADEPFAVRIDARPAGEPGRAVVALATQAGVGTIRYTLDGSSPTPASAAYAVPLAVAPPVKVAAATFVDTQRVGRERRAAVTRESLLRHDERELEHCSNAIVLALEDDAPIDGPRASFLLDIMNPCYRLRDVDLSQPLAVSASVGQLPFNFEIGELVDRIELGPPDVGAGTLTIHLNDCTGPELAAVPLAPATLSHATTVLPAAPLRVPADAAAVADLCITFIRPSIEPLWALDWLQLVPVDAADVP